MSVFFFIHAKIMQNQKVIAKQYEYYEISSSYIFHRVRAAMLIN